jgi:surfactin synthase thioesterase subunit
MPAHFGIFPEAEVQLLDGGHLLLETNLDEFVPVVRDFLGRAHPPAPMPQSLS